MTVNAIQASRPAAFVPPGASHAVRPDGVAARPSAQGICFPPAARAMQAAPKAEAFYSDTQHAFPHDSGPRIVERLSARRWPRGLGLTAAGLMSLAMWLGLISLAVALFGG